ncbi:MAG: site-specific integrase [Actinomycetota bacterium]|nr:site-specific integrase [Actinomycetota bacterium]
MRWTDLVLDRATVWSKRGIVSGFTGLVEKDTKNHAARRVTLDPTARAALTARRDRAVERARACVSTSSTPAPSCSATRSTAPSPGTPDSVSRAFARLCRKAGITGVRLHDLRHFVATRLLSSGTDVRTVAGRLGHRNAATTLNVYSHFLAESDRDAANVLGRIFDDAVTAAAGASDRSGDVRDDLEGLVGGVDDDPEPT